MARLFCEIPFVKRNIVVTTLRRMSNSENILGPASVLAPLNQEKPPRMHRYSKIKIACLNCGRAKIIKLGEQCKKNNKLHYCDFFHLYDEY